MAAREGWIWDVLGGRKRHKVSCPSVSLSSLRSGVSCLVVKLSRDAEKTSDSAAVAGLTLVSTKLDWCPGVAGRHKVGVLPCAGVHCSCRVVNVRKTKGKLKLKVVAES